MKIGIVLDPNLKIPGGVQEHCRGLYDALKKLGQEVVIIACGEKGEEDKERKVVSLGKIWEMKFLGRSSSLPLTWQNPLIIKQFLAKENFDFLLFEGPGGIFSLEVLALSSTINVLVFHIFPEKIDFSYFALPFFPFLRFLNRKFAGWIAVSPVAERYAQRFYPGEYEIIPNGVDLSRFTPKGEKLEEFVDGKINVLFVGRLDPRKGLMHLLKAFWQLKRRFANLRLLIVGDGPLRKKAERFVKEKNLEDVVFLGRVLAEKLPICYRTGDIFCAPSLYGESFGIVLLEAMASSLPVVAFANEGYKWVLRKKPFSDFLVEVGDVEGLVEKIGALIKDKDLRKRLGEAGVREARKYSWEEVGRRVLKFCQITENKKQKSR